MVSRGAAKRSSSAHALMETDRMSEGATSHRWMMKMRGEAQYPNGDITSRPRLRGEMETSSFIIPPSKPTNILRRQNSDSTAKEQTLQSGNKKQSSSKHADIHSSSKDFKTQSNPSLSMIGDGRSHDLEQLEKSAPMGLSNHVELVRAHLYSDIRLLS